MVSNPSLKSSTPPPPRHVAIIMDGNGRWAKARGLPRVAGHQRGVDALRGVVEAGQEMAIDYLTLYAFSSENWKRPPTEVDDLMGLLRLYLPAALDSPMRPPLPCRCIVLGLRPRGACHFSASRRR